MKIEEDTISSTYAGSGSTFHEAIADALQDLSPQDIQGTYIVVIIKIIKEENKNNELQ